MADADVIVVGLGAMGSAALAELAARGVSALGIEQFGVPHGEGSSGGDTRLIRQAYFEHPDYVPLLARAYRKWRALEAETGTALLHTTGTLYLGRPDGELVVGSRRSAAVHGLTLEDVDPAALATDFPQFRCPEDYVALFEPQAGFLLCERAIRAQVDRALHHGARLVTHQRVAGWQADAGGVRVTTSAGVHRAARLVIAGGSWSAQLLAELDLTLTVTRQPMFWIRPEPAADFALGRMPCWAVQRPDHPGLFYGFPSLPAALANQLGAKLAHHTPGEVAAVDEPRGGATAAELDAVLRAVKPFLPGCSGAVTGSRVCTYTMSADGHFLVDVHPRHDNVVFACGFSGHGFKFATVMGEALADLALTGRSGLSIEFLGLR